MVDSLLSLLLACFLVLLFLRILFRFVPAWLLVAILAIFIFDEVLHPQVVKKVLASSFEMVAPFLTLFLVLLGMRLIFKAFGMKKKR